MGRFSLIELKCAAVYGRKIFLKILHLGNSWALSKILMHIRKVIQIVMCRKFNYNNLP